MQMDLDGLWRFLPDPTGEGVAHGYAQPQYEDRLWREVKTPCDFEMANPALDAYEGPAWYRRWVEIPSDWEEKRLVLRFEGVNVRATVYVNGKKCAYQQDPYLPFEAELGDLVISRDRMLIAVCVDNTRRHDDVPGMERGWRTYGGMLRDVTLIATDYCYVADVEILAELTPEGGLLSADYYVRNERATAVNIAMQVCLLGENGETIWENNNESDECAPGGAVQFTYEDFVAGIAPWSPDNPQLYTLSATLTLNGEFVGKDIRRIGFRSIETRENTLLLNGNPIYLTGFNRHEDSAKRHMCTDLEAVRSDLTQMKRAGANFVRLCHYPHHPAELDMCDELGLLVMDEIPLYWWRGQAGGAYEEKLVSAERQLVSLIRRDRNHPSVIFWSVSNETEEQQPGVAEGNAKLVNLAKTLDPTRLAVHVSNHWHKAPRFEADDVICVNGYPSVSQRFWQDKKEYDFGKAELYWRVELQALHDMYPDKPILVAEFGYEGMQGVSDGAWSEGSQAKALGAEFAGMQADYVCGATVWCWADHAWNPSTFEFAHYIGISPYGVVGRDRRPKQALHAIRDLFKQKQHSVEEQVESEMRGDAGIPVIMVRDTMLDLPVYSLPEGYTIRAMREDEGGLWTDIWRDAEQWGNIPPDLYHHEFGSDYPATTWRSFIVEDPRGLAVATITSWYNRTFKGQDYGQIHWVATRQSQWGKGIGRGMLGYALQQMAQWHERAFLGTQTNRIPAIKLYLDFGFRPDMDQPYAEQAWREVMAVLSHPLLDQLTLKDEGVA